MSLWLSLPSNPSFSTSKTGNVSGGNFFEIEADGTDVRNGDATVWDDQRYPATAQNLDVSGGRIDFNYSTLTIDYQANARFPNEPLGIVAQLSHARKPDSDIFPHIHWVQNQNNFPNLMIEYRWFNNGAAPGSFTQLALSAANSVFTYVSGDLAQITSIPLPGGFGTGKALSSFFEVKIYRDNNNNSGLFAGSDPYSGVFLLKEFDIHIEKDMDGSRQEFIK